MIIKKQLCFILTISALWNAAFLHAHGKGDNGKTTLTIYGLKGPSGVGIIRLFDSPPKISGFKVKVEALAPQPDLLVARFISGEAKIGILPVNMAAKIASSGRDIRVLAVIGEGMLSLLSSDPSVRSLGDLKGKTVEVSSGQGATPDFVFRRILTRRGIDPDRDLTLGYALSYPEITQSLITGKVSIALIPEPFATMALLGKPELFVAADIQEEWKFSEGGGNYPMTFLVAYGAFASANPIAVNSILDAVRDSIEWVNAQPAEAGVLAEKHDLGLRAPVVATAIPKSNYVCIPAAEARPSIEVLFKVFLEFAPASIGGVLPADRFYWNGTR
jgi:NitT/TauT family transport system substrate-binding protein